MNRQTTHLLFPLILTAALFAADQITKALACAFLSTSGHTLVPGIFELRYLENCGAAFGIFRNMQWIFVLFALLVLAASLYIYPRIPVGKRYAWLRLICCFLNAGALGNMADRCIHGYVIDFLYFKLIDFPIFNVADIYVCASCILFLILTLFYYTDDELESIIRNRKKERYLRELKSAIDKERAKDE